MADSMCGPSTALKSFSDHTNRDRSLHQDRAAIPGRAGSSNFRSLSAGPSNDAEVHAFTTGAPLGLQQEALNLPSPLDMVAGPPIFQQLQQQPHVRTQFPGMASHSSVQPLHLQSMSMQSGGTQSTGWASEFAARRAGATQQTHIHSLAPTASLTAPNAYGEQTNNLFHPHQHQHQPFSFANVYTPMPLNYATPSAPGLHQPQQQQQQSLFTATEPAQTIQTMGHSISVGGLSEADLEARFAQIEADTDFEQEMDKWMASYGPTAEERGEAAVAMGSAADVKQRSNEALRITPEVEVTTSTATAATLDTGLEQMLAETQLESEARHAGTDEAADAVAAADAEQKEHEQQKSQDDLSRTAEQIAHVLDSHPEPRFRESNFIHLMRRIQNREVVVRGEDLIDETTGQPVDVAGSNGISDGSHNPNDTTMESDYAESPAV